MQIPPIPQDDLLDVMEMTQKIESFILKTIKGNEIRLGISSLIGASINSILAQCKTLDEVIACRNIFIQVFDESIRNIKIKN